MEGEKKRRNRGGERVVRVGSTFACYSFPSIKECYSCCCKDFTEICQPKLPVLVLCSCSLHKASKQSVLITYINLFNREYIFGEDLLYLPAIILQGSDRPASALCWCRAKTIPQGHF